MTDFVIVAAALALASPAAPPSPAPSPAPVPLTAPAAGSRVYPDVASCEQAIAGLVTPPGSRLLCLPVERLVEEASNAY